MNPSDEFIEYSDMTYRDILQENTKVNYQLEDIKTCKTNCNVKFEKILTCTTVMDPDLFIR